MSQLLPEPDGRPITEQEIREALDKMVERNGRQPIAVDGTAQSHKLSIKAKKPFT